MELLKDRANGLAVEFFSHRDLAARVCESLEDPQRVRPLRAAARRTAVTHFDLAKRTLPRWERLLEDVVSRRAPRLHG